MKVAIVRNAFTYDFGGAERLSVHLAQELQQNGIRTIVVSRQPRLLAYAKELSIDTQRSWWWSKQNWNGIWVLAFPLYLAWQFILFIWYLAFFIRFRPDAVHALSKDDFIAATFAGRLLGKRVVWTDPADLKHVFRNHPIWYKNPVGKLVYLASRLAGSVTLVSESEKRLIAESVGHELPSNFKVIHLAGRDETVRAHVRTVAEMKVVIFCSTSRLVKAKGIGDLVQAFNALSEGNNKYQLWLIGDGPDQEEFMELAASNPAVRFFGHSDEPLKYVAACDVFVHPTYHEGFSLSLAEAAMLGKPMIATDVGGNPELVNSSNGMLVPVRSVEDLRAAMRRLGEDAPLRHKLGKQARHDYVTKFDFSTIVKTRIMPLYEKAR